MAVTIVVGAIVRHMDFFDASNTIREAGVSVTKASRCSRWMFRTATPAVHVCGTSSRILPCLAYRRSIRGSSCTITHASTSGRLRRRRRQRRRQSSEVATLLIRRARIYVLMCVRVCTISEKVIVTKIPPTRCFVTVLQIHTHRVSRGSQREGERSHLDRRYKQRISRILFLYSATVGASAATGDVGGDGFNDDAAADLLSRKRASTSIGSLGLSWHTFSIPSSNAGIIF